MFHDDQKNDNKQMFSEREVIKVCSAQKLLSTIDHTIVLKEIDDLVVQKRRPLYRQLTKNFAEFVQALPVDNISMLGSILEQGLHRGLYTLQNYHLEEENPDPLVDYMLYSAALLFDVAKVVEERTVFLSELDGSAIREWLPHEGAIKEYAKYYRVRRGGGIGAALGRKVTPILAHSLMPVDGYDWLAKRPKLLRIWIALLLDEQLGSGGYEEVFKKARKRLQKLLKTGKGFSIAVDTIEPEGTKVGEEFLEWLRKNIKNGKIKINEKDALVFMTAEGLFLSITNLIKLFSRYNPRYEAGQVYDQFKMLGIVPLSGGDMKFTSYVDTAAEASQVESALNLSKRSMFEHAKSTPSSGSFRDHLHTELQNSSTVVQNLVNKRNGVLATANNARVASAVVHQAQTLNLRGANTSILKEGVVVGDRMVGLIIETRPALARNLQLLSSATAQLSNGIDFSAVGR